ncbi:MAG: ATP-binding cassette domain-containing protein [Aestuariivirga sp.]|uniref:ABC-F family ATP-binding cassette domain-containing protein n=1 Tax=Aestuariivirga sp. TaxID=2650926 RepID=UPI0025C1D922|nr:ATP-binding cassette domain-containing protein [Aestuariivirga sp.]MCA3561657.1 ATP-binding cassette domain-containing protein [Aestuariivirga sp.]
MSRILLHLRGIGVTFGGRPILENAELAVAEGERVALVGRNGSGKSTLLKIAAGMIEAGKGERWVQPGATIRYLPQEPDLSAYKTVLDYVESGLGPADDPHRCTYLLRELGLTGEEDPKRLSGGEIRRAAIARTLAPQPDVLLLDEPTNHLDLPAIEWLEAELKSLRSAFVLISHDRRFLQSLTNRTVWLDRGESRRLERGFAGFETWRDEVLAKEEAEQVLLAKRIEAEEHWMRYGVTARRKRNMRRVDLLATLRKERKEHEGQQGAVRMAATSGGMPGKLVAEAKAMSKSFGERPIVSNLDLLVMRGDRLGIAGPNGAGKTTLIKLLTGVLEPDSGAIRLGTNLQTVTLDQSRQSLDPNATLADVITDGRGNSVTVNGGTKHVVSYMKDFLFPPDKARTPVSVLSGGERGRLILARELAKPSNLLILDEPTNDLDLETLDMLQEMLADYPGTILLVSHDRDFLDRVATSVLMAEGDGKWTEYAGGYSDMVTQRGTGVEVRKAKAEPAKASSAPKAEAPQARRKLSFKEKHALETLPATMKMLENEIGTLEAKLADASLFARDPKAFDRAASRLTAARDELANSEEQWLELEMKREMLEG